MDTNQLFLCSADRAAAKVACEREVIGAPPPCPAADIEDEYADAYVVGKEKDLTVRPSSANGCGATHFSRWAGGPRGRAAVPPAALRAPVWQPHCGLQSTLHGTLESCRLHPDPKVLAFCVRRGTAV